MRNFLPLEKESGQFIYSFDGWDGNIQRVTLGFKGKPDFIARMQNLLLNYQFHSTPADGLLVEDTWIIHGDMDRLLEALTRHFYNEFQITHKEEIDWEMIQYNLDTEEEQTIISYNEEKLANLAREKAEMFFEERFECDSAALKPSTARNKAYEYSSSYGSTVRFESHEE